MRDEVRYTKQNKKSSKPKKQITIRLDTNTIEYFKSLAEKTDISYQTLINLYLRDCAENDIKPNIKWE